MSFWSGTDLVQYSAITSCIRELCFILCPCMETPEYFAEHMGTVLHSESYHANAGFFLTEYMGIILHFKNYYGDTRLFYRLYWKLISSFCGTKVRRKIVFCSIYGK